MGTRTLGSTSGPANNVQYYYESYSGGDILKGNDGQSTSDTMYVDSIHVYCGSYSGSQYFQFGIYTTGNHVLGTTGNAGPFGTGYGWNSGTFAPGSYLQIAPNTFIVGAVQAPNNIQTAGKADGGSFASSHGSTWPNPWNGGTVSGLGNLAWYITYFPAATITSLSASQATQNQSITIYGQSFSAGVNAVQFNGLGASFTYVNDTQIVATVPSGATSGPIQVFTNAGTATSGTFYIEPQVTNISPSQGNPGTTVTVTGTGFTGVEAVNGGSVDFSNGVSATYTVNSDTQLTVQVPAGAVTGPITLHTPNTAADSATFTVLTSITGFSPTAGGAGTAVTISGTGFTGATAVKFNGTSATFTVISDTSISTSVPNGATSGPISVTGTGGTATSSASFTVAPGWFKASGSLQRLKGMWYKSGGTLHPIKGAWYKSGGTLHPLK